MMYKILHTNQDDQTIFARIDDDGKCRITCIAADHAFQEHIKTGGELQDAEGQVMTPEAVQAFVATLP
jgi:hypothetical protein